MFLFPGLSTHQNSFLGSIAILIVRKINIFYEWYRLPASTWAKIPMTSFLMVPLPVPKTAGRHCPAGPLCSVYSHFRGFSPSNQGQKPMRPSLSLISSGLCLNAPPQTSPLSGLFGQSAPDFQQMLQKWFYIFISFSILKIYFHFVIMQLLNLKTEGSLCALTLSSALTP